MGGGKSGKKSVKRKNPSEENEEDLNRFAGSSDEDNEVESDVDGEEETEVAMSDGRTAVTEGKEKAKDGDEQEVGDDEDSNSGSDESDEEENNITGMASAMSKILGVQAKKGTQSVVLSKTKTPLQRQAAQEKQLLKEAREKRKLNRDKHLVALHVPLSVATSLDLGGGSLSVVKELEQERAHRRVATRGVVALFNAIAQHQYKSNETVSTKKYDNGKSVGSTMTKHSFLDKIKSTAAKKEIEREGKAASTTQITTANQSKSKWLKEDYMLGPKLKDWDKESSDEDKQDDEPINDDWDDENTVETASKRQKMEA